MLFLYLDFADDIPGETGLQSLHDRNDASRLYCLLRPVRVLDHDGPLRHQPDAPDSRVAPASDDDAYRPVVFRRVLVDVRLVDLLVGLKDNPALVDGQRVNVKLKM